MAKKYLEILSISLIFTLIGCSSSDSTGPEDPGIEDDHDTNVLFIGNSYTGYMPDIFQELANSSGKDVFVDMSVRGGRQLPFFVHDSATIAKIYEREWDYVVFQQFQVITESEDRIWRHLDNAIEMDSIIHDSSPLTKTVLFMEQAYADGDPTYDTEDDFFKMSARVIRGSKSYARQMGSNPIIAPVAAVWAEIYRYSFEWRETYRLHEPDGSHPSIYGAYTTASTFYTTIFREALNCVYYGEVDTLFAIQAQRIASSVVLDSLDSWNNQQ